MFVVNELKKIEPVANIDIVRNAFLEVLHDLVNYVISDKSMFSIDDFFACYYDEFSFQTNCHKDIFSKVYLEIDQLLNYKLISEKVKKKAKFSFPELYITLDEFLDCLYNSCINNLDSNYLIWKDAYSINIKATINDEDNLVHHYFFQIVPCITHFNSNNVRGVMYKKNNGIEIEYPTISLDNYYKKNTATCDRYRETVLIFKNILLKDKNINSLPNEIIEIMLYNVPNNMFVDDSKQTLLNIINYLRNNSIKNFRSLDEQDNAFTSVYRSLSLIYVKHIIKIIEKYLLTN